MIKEMVENGCSCENKSEEEPQTATISRRREPKCAPIPILTKAMLVFVVCSIGFVLFSQLNDPYPSPDKSLWTALHNFKLFKKDEPDQLLKDKFLGGLLPQQGLDENSCLSRYQAVLYYRRHQIRRPSSHLISRLRNYEALHKKCGPYTESYNETLEYLKSGQHSTTTLDCNYVVWIGISGLGNKMLTLVSAFLYALLTNRVLLVHPGGYIPDLFCEPFPGASWLLPTDFPITDKFLSFNQRSPYSYGNMLRHNVFSNSTGSSSSSLPPPFVYLHLLHDYTDHDKLFFCDQEQILLQKQKVPWLIIKSDEYFIPSFFLMQSFIQQLENLFPDKTAVFHLLGQYLFHPTNTVWGLITRYYNAYLARADEITGIQIRTFEKFPGPFKHVMDQIFACIRNKNLLPGTNDKNPMNKPSKKPKTKAVLITSLSSGYFEAMRDLYWQHQTDTGDIIGVYQPSQEQHQQTHKKMHNMKALAEIYLLSLADKLVSSSSSTFGYVAQSLGGLKPWILMKPENQTVPEPACRRVMSMEPCFHAAPSHGCGRKRGVDAGKIVPIVQHCEDRRMGLKLVNIEDIKF